MTPIWTRPEQQRVTRALPPPPCISIMHNFVCLNPFDTLTHIIHSPPSWSSNFFYHPITLISPACFRPFSSCPRHLKPFALTTSLAPFLTRHKQSRALQRQAATLRLWKRIFFYSLNPTSKLLKGKNSRCWNKHNIAIMVTVRATLI